ncbi:membrane protein [Burkholderia sp. MSh2]|uniref:Membrane protein n=1 Tax=Burkholderia paludis TaxID=1506587 RepID=A0A6J5D4N1_9BURK|nr:MULTISPECIES: DUF4156 domain-containing protein [Burkholderia]KEZ02998.1 membrane protein [Burkholderia sp. MSh2]KFG98267.1 membrane protein [Burkholderia paludis]CAB3749240.1 hypothetical protein LMG30113_00831 [Burkholderia paludis]VWB20356.1 membrane protein [Burkholderia paludis]
MRPVWLLFLPAALAACAPLALSSAGREVRVVTTDPGAACRYLGDVTGSQGNFLTGGFIPDTSLETGARHDLKNRAAALGGNLVVLLTQRAAQSGSFDGTDGGFLRQTGVTLTGSVYRCPGNGA